MILDSAVSAAVAQARLLETALHSQRPWYIEVGGVKQLATRTVEENTVSFTATFRGVPEAATIAALYEGSQMRAAQSFTHPGVVEFALTWNLTLEVTVPT